MTSEQLDEWAFTMMRNARAWFHELCVEHGISAEEEQRAASIPVYINGVQACGFNRELPFHQRGPQ